MHCSMSFGKNRSSGSGCENPMLRSRKRGVELKENVMRVSMLVLAMSMVCFAAPAPAQTVIDVEGQKAASPPAPEQRKSRTAR